MAANVLTNTKQDLIAAEVLRELKENATLLPMVKDYSHLAIKGAKSISLPKLSSFVVGTEHLEPLVLKLQRLVQLLILLI